MVREVYSVYDSATKMFLLPFNSVSQGEAMRNWIQAVNDPKTLMHQSPHDFSLQRLGKWDDSTGKYEQLVAPERISLATEVHQDHNKGVQ